MKPECKAHFYCAHIVAYLSQQIDIREKQGKPHWHLADDVESLNLAALAAEMHAVEIEWQEAVFMGEVKYLPLFSTTIH